MVDARTPELSADFGISPLVALLPRLTSLVVYGDSVERDPEVGAVPEPRRLLHMAAGRLAFVVPAAALPAWVRPIVADAIVTDEFQSERGRRSDSTPGSGPAA